MAGTISAKPVLAWIEKELPPLSWNIIAMKMMRQFISHKIMPSRISDDAEFAPEIMTEMRKLIKELYNKELPQNLEA